MNICEQTGDTLVIEFPMLPSANKMRRADVTRAGRPFSYTPASIRRLEARICLVTCGVAYLSGWVPTSEDRYAIHYRFWFRSELVGDLDNPLKATNDMLHRTIGEALAPLSKRARGEVCLEALCELQESWREVLVNSHLHKQRFAQFADTLAHHGVGPASESRVL